ncbi:pilus assembly protein [bacterium]|nr:pilus assembly protein [bacterium]
MIYISNRNGKKGQSLLEMALIIPIFLFIIVGMAEFFSIITTKITLINATRSAARFASLNMPFDDHKLDSVVYNQVKDYSTTVLASDKFTSIIVNFSNDTQGNNHVSVNSDYKYKLIFPFHSVMSLVAPPSEFMTSGEFDLSSAATYPVRETGATACGGCGKKIGAGSNFCIYCGVAQ